MSTSASAQRPLRCGLVGLTFIASAPAVPTITGGRGILPYSHASALARLPHLIELVAICDIVPAMIDRFQAEWGGTWPELHTYLDVNAMIAQEQLDILAVVTPDDRHADIVVAAAQAGISAIMCEKPLATTLVDADRIIGAIEANGTLMTVEHTRRWDPYFHQVKALIEAGGYAYPASQTPWQEIQRALVGQMNSGAILEGAEKYQRIAQTMGLPRDNH